jgi:signal transduction histidine kinase
LKNEIQNNKLLILGKLAAGLAHEIRNPLSAIQLELESMEMAKDELTDEVMDSISMCKEATERIKNIIETTLVFSRRGVKTNLNNNLNEIAEQTISLVLPLVRQKNIKISSELKDNLPLLTINKNRILQVTINLVTNAIEACENGGLVKIRTKSSKNNDVYFEVSDNGPGIKDEEKEKIFSDFFTTKKSGTGLGLTVCKSIVEDQNAEIGFKSEFGSGSTFFIKFPASLTEG